MGKLKSVDQKILDYLSSPRSKDWISAKALSRYLREPLEHVEHYICLLTDLGLIIGVKEVDTDKYWVRTLWSKKRQVRQDS